MGRDAFRPQSPGKIRNNDAMIQESGAVVCGICREWFAYADALQIHYKTVVHKDALDRFLQNIKEIDSNNEEAVIASTTGTTITSVGDAGLQHNTARGSVSNGSMTEEILDDTEMDRNTDDMDTDDSDDSVDSQNETEGFHRALAFARSQCSSWLSYAKCAWELRAGMAVYAKLGFDDLYYPATIVNKHCGASAQHPNLPDPQARPESFQLRFDAAGEVRMIPAVDIVVPQCLQIGQPVLVARESLSGYLGGGVVIDLVEVEGIYRLCYRVRFDNGEVDLVTPTHTLVKEFMAGHADPPWKRIQSKPAYNIQSAEDDDTRPSNGRARGEEKSNVPLPPTNVRALSPNATRPQDTFHHNVLPPSAETIAKRTSTSGSGFAGGVAVAFLTGSTAAIRIAPATGNIPATSNTAATTSNAPATSNTLPTGHDTPATPTKGTWTAEDDTQVHASATMPPAPMPVTILDGVNMHPSLRGHVVPGGGKIVHGVTMMASASLPYCHYTAIPPRVRARQYCSGCLRYVGHSDDVTTCSQCAHRYHRRCLQRGLWKPRNVASSLPQDEASLASCPRCLHGNIQGKQRRPMMFPVGSQRLFSLHNPSGTAGGEAGTRTGPAGTDTNATSLPDEVTMFKHRSATLLGRNVYPHTQHGQSHLPPTHLVPDTAPPYGSQHTQWVQPLDSADVAGTASRTSPGRKKRKYTKRAKPSADTDSGGDSDPDWTPTQPVPGVPGGTVGTRGVRLTPSYMSPRHIANPALHPASLPVRPHATFRPDDTSILTADGARGKRMCLACFSAGHTACYMPVRRKFCPRCGGDMQAQESRRLQLKKSKKYADQQLNPALRAGLFAEGGNGKRLCAACRDNGHTQCYVHVRKKVCPRCQTQLL